MYTYTHIHILINCMYRDQTRKKKNYNIIHVVVVAVRRKKRLITLILKEIFSIRDISAINYCIVLCAYV